MKTAALLLFLATAFPAEPVPFVDASVSALAPAGTPFDPMTLIPYVLPALGLFAVSLAASFWSDYVRRLGPKASPWMLSLSAALNVAAANPHKAARAAKASKAPEVKP